MAKRNMAKRLIAASVAALMSFSVVSNSGLSMVEAAAPFATLNGRSYSDFEDFVDDLEDDYEDKSVTIEMLRDWNAASDDDFDELLEIPEGANVTLNMHGYVFNRNRCWNNGYGRYGGLIYVNKNAKLTINGYSTDAEKKRVHGNVATYNSTDNSRKADKLITVYGGLLCGGGNTTGGGAISILESATVVLNDVTIAGCRAEQRALTNGYGGGIWMPLTGSRLTMNRSTITGCFAYNDGGGISADETANISIELNDSHIDRNFAKSDAGGIDGGCSSLYINGSGESTISYNQCNDYGGGIYAYCKDISISRLTLVGNKAKEGAGVYLNEKNDSISGLVLKDNEASERGGGVYVYRDGASISGCEITGNRAGISGAGVYVSENVDEDFNVSGKVIVKNNTPCNFYMSDDDPEDNRVNFKLTKGSDVHYSYYTTKNKDAIMVTQGKVGDTIKTPNCIEFLTPDDAGYHFTFNSAPNQRKIYYVKNGKDDASKYGSPVSKPPAPTTVTALNANIKPDEVGNKTTKAGIVGTVGPGGGTGTQYNLIRGFSHHEETDSPTVDTDCSFYYSDGFFDSNQFVYNEHIATASLAMAYSGMYLRALEEQDENGNTYYNKHAAARQFMADIGCPDQNIYVNDSNEKKPGTDTIGVTIASKELTYADGTPTGKILIPIAVRGGGYELEWASNATLGKYEDVTDKQGNVTGEAKGFSNAADQVEDEIKFYIKKYQLEDELQAGNVVFWISGYSRAGATANLTAKRLVEMNKFDYSPKNQIFAYTCEAPMGGTDAAERSTWKEDYYCIHNLVNAVDIVPMVAPQPMGFKRYGVDHYIPGTTAGEVKVTRVETPRSSGGDSSVTTYRDNDPIYVRNVSSTVKNKMNNQLKAVDSGIVLDDYFHPMSMDFAPNVKFYEDGDYGGHVEVFVKDFTRFVMEGTEPNNLNHWSQAVRSRDDWANNIQPAMRETLALVFTMSDEDSAGFIGRASTFMDNMSAVGGDLSKTEIYRKLIGDWHELSDDEKKSYSTKLWNKIEETGAFDYLDASEKSKLQKNWPAIAEFLFRLIDGDYKYNPHDHGSHGWDGNADNEMMYVATFATFATFILQNHYPEVNLAWARAYDSYYDSDTTEYTVSNSNYSVEYPDATGKEMTTAGELVDKQLYAGPNNSNKLQGDQKIILEVPDIVGEAVYYDLEDVTNGTMLAQNKLYRGGVDVSLGTDLKHDYKITTYAISYGIRSDEAIYNINLVNEMHKIIVADVNGTTEYLYKEKSKPTITAATNDDTLFKKWTVDVLNEDGTVWEYGSDVGASLGTIAPDFVSTNISTKFRVPSAKEKLAGRELPEGFGFKFTADYIDRIKKISASPVKPVATDPASVLAEETSLIFTWGSGASAVTKTSTESYPISWTYSYEDTDGTTKTVPTSGGSDIYADSVYTATITVPKDEANDIIFAATLSGETATGESITVTRNNADGSATIKVVFPKTDASGPARPDEIFPLTVRAFDLNLRGYDGTIEEYHVFQGSVVTLTAPDVANEMFVSWDLSQPTVDDNKKITLVDGESLTSKTIKVRIPNGLSLVDVLAIDAQYIPVLQSIDVILDEPVGGQVMQTGALDTASKETMQVKISNTYTVDPEFVTIEWSPEPLEDGTDKIADYLTTYTAKVTLVPKLDNENKPYIRAKGTTGGYQTTTAMFYYAENVVARVNGNSAVCDKTDNSVSYTFPMTKYKLVSVEQPEDIYDVPYGTDNAGIAALLPKTIKLLLDNGSEMDAPVTWNLTKGAQADPREAVVWTATPIITLPDTVIDSDDVLPSTSIEVLVNVNEADHAQSPKASLESGEYVNDQYVTLTTRETGGTTYYTVDGSDPMASSTRKVYSGEEIPVTRDDATGVDTEGNKVFELKAYTEKAGVWESAIVSYGYTFTNNIPVPEDGKFTYDGTEQKLISSNRFYTVESISGGGKIDADGNATATKAGTYKVTLKINDGYKWAKGDDTTVADQVVTFTINPMSLEDAVIEILSEPERANGEPIEPKIRVTLYGEELSPDDYDIIYTDNIKSGEGKVRIKGKGNYTGETEDVPFEILKGEFSLTFNLGGGTLNGQTGTYTMVCEEGSTIKMPLPTRDGYVFDYWKGSEYLAGDDYTVVENHTFEAIWVKQGEKGKYSDGTNPGTRKTGDNAPLVVLTMVMILSLIGIAGVILIRRKRRRA